MVSNYLKMTDQELMANLERIHRDHGNDPEYQAIRRDIPADWPM